MEIGQFDFKYMPSLVNRIVNLWTPPDMDEQFKRIYAEAVIRQDMHDNDFQFQIVEKNQLMAVACASKKNEKNSAGEWWNEKYKILNQGQQFSFKLSREYLTLMDEKTYAFMNEDDVKLNLFISIKKGWGKMILDEVISNFKNRGYKNMFLWTDSDCNVDWYVSHNYELVNEDVYELFSSKDKPYRTYIFKKKLNTNS